MLARNRVGIEAGTAVEPEAGRVTHNLLFSNGPGNFINFPSAFGTTTDTTPSGAPVDHERNVLADPQFLGETDFRLVTDSPAIDAGLDLADAPFTDLDGDPRTAPIDIGAFECKTEPCFAARGANQGLVHINAGGDQVTTSGITWRADTAFQSGFESSTMAPIANTEDDVLFQSERFGDFRYDIRLVSGCYRVVLHFAEIAFTSDNDAGARVFNVEAEEQLVLENVDVHAEAGGGLIAIAKPFDIRVDDGMLNLAFISIANNAKISAIEVRDNDLGCTAMPGRALK